MFSEPGSGETGRPARFDAVVIGAGFAGLYMLYRLRELGLSVRVYERGSDVGGTWYWNQYPGARCDIESVSYSYSFSPELEQEWDWTERYASQAEILAYLRHVADRFDLRRSIVLDTTVVELSYDERSSEWEIVTDQGDRARAGFCITATGCLSDANVPGIDGLGQFKGEWYHTGAWPHEPVELTGKRVGVIGTGSSGVQAIPLLARDAARLVVFQRTANFVLPARNRPIPPDELAELKRTYPERRELVRKNPRGSTLARSAVSAMEVTAAERARVFQERWDRGGAGSFATSFSDVMSNADSNKAAAEFIWAKIEETVRDPAVASRLLPTTYQFGARRICVGTDFYETFNRPNVQLIDVSGEPIVEFVPEGIRTAGRTVGLDAVVFATGFDAITGALLNIAITGRGGVTLRDRWAERPGAYLGLSVAGFPNLFTLTGPGSPSVLGNVVVSIEQHVEWLTGLLAHALERGTTVIEAEREAEAAWAAHVDELAQETLFVTTSSWYLGGNIPGKPKVFLPYAGGVGNFRVRCDQIAAAGYPGFRLAPPA